jgi:hypothetical protein
MINELTGGGNAIKDQSMLIKSRTEKQRMAGEPDTSKGVRPVRWEGHRNLTWEQEKALAPYPTITPYTFLIMPSADSRDLFDNGKRGE